MRIALACVALLSTSLEGALDSPPGGDVVLFAARSVQLTIPHGWTVREAPSGREVRLLVSPGPPAAGDAPRNRQPGPLPTVRRDRPAPPDESRKGAGQLWISLHPGAQRIRPPGTSLAEAVTARTRLAAGRKAALGELRAMQISGWPAVAQDYDLDDPGAGPGRAGRHYLVETNWAICELHTAAESRERADQLFQNVIGGMRLAPPASDFGRVSPRLQSAAPIVGAWKAYRSRLRLYGDGQIEILPDPRHATNVEQEGTQRAGRLRGRFQARNDLLLVQWDDGSRLNFRWRLHGQDLLLTDHDGRMSLLRRLLE